MKSAMKKYPIASYFVLAYALSWLLWIPAALVVTSAEEPPEWTFFLVILGIYGASGAGFFMTGIMDGKDGVRAELLRAQQTPSHAQAASNCGGTARHPGRLPAH